MKKNILIILLSTSIFAAFLLAALITSIYIDNNMSIFPLNGDRTAWGVTGDFFGGILNPTLSFMGLVMLLATLYQNQKELELSRKELAASSKALTEQANTLEAQRFENTFFSLLQQHNNCLDNICTDTVTYRSGGEAYQKRALSYVTYRDISSLKIETITIENSILKSAWNILERNKEDFSQYFNILFELLNLIYENAPRSPTKNDDKANTPEQELKYANIVLSIIPLSVLTILAIYCYGPTRNAEKYRNLVIRYSFLRYMDLIETSPTIKKLQDEILVFYKDKNLNPDKQ